MEMANCRKCKKVFPRINDPICDACKKEEEDVFHTVVEFLRDHPKATIAEVTEGTGVSAKKIMGYLRDGRIEVASKELACRHCGCKISSGIYCEPCTVEVNLQINNLAGGKLPSSRPMDNDGKKVIMHSRKK